MLVKQLLPEICHFIHTYREGHQHAAELRASASAVLFSLSCNNFNAVFSRISTRCSSDRRRAPRRRARRRCLTSDGLRRLQELTVCTEDNVDVHDIELMQYINVDCSKLKRLLQGHFLPSHLHSPLSFFFPPPLKPALMLPSRNRVEVPSAQEARPARSHQQSGEGAFASVLLRSAARLCSSAHLCASSPDV